MCHFHDRDQTAWTELFEAIEEEEAEPETDNSDEPREFGEPVLTEPALDVPGLEVDPIDADD